MSRFAKQITPTATKLTKIEKENLTVNLAGGYAFNQDPEMQLVSILLTSFVQDKVYLTAGKELENLWKLAQLIPDKKFIAKAAIYARKQGMRSITHALLAMLPQLVKGEDWVKEAIAKGIVRADDPAEILAFHMLNFGGPIPNSLKKGINKGLAQFNAYHLAKYRKASNGFGLIDVFNLTHPKPINEEQKEAFHQLMTGALPAAETWEVALTKAGQKAKTEEDKLELKGEAWKTLIENKKLGYFALLRNLNNIFSQADEKTQKLALEMLVDPEAIKKSMVLPFRFLVAMENLSAPSRKLTLAIDQALEISLRNVPRFEGRTLIAVDKSGSMSGKPIIHAAIFASVLYKTNDADMVVFDTTASPYAPIPHDSVTTIANGIRNLRKGGGTDFTCIWKAVEPIYDRIIILSDMQSWVNNQPTSTTFRKWNKNSGKNPFIYSWDLQGYGTLQFPEPQVFCLAGWNSEILTLMQKIEKDPQILLNEIRATEL